ncbi:hypothetical protein D6D21_09887 [Aureobasidium pullulans]|uniref:F-box domain-containing protein n=1 Tax=Aureobasidium pullulans TaxID=5580 RepID=A0AB74IJJ4_AURPU|nr:hypothetical protein D6D21_09887 [Aureobasidium pullulans]
MVRTSIRHGRFSLTGNVQVAVQDANPLLLGMPNEVLSMIVDHAGPQAFPALRLTNKHLRAIANKPFAILNFSERKHVQSLHSMEALVEITAHAFFGIFVKKVIVSAFRPEVERSRYYPENCGSCRRPEYAPCVDLVEDSFQYEKYYSIREVLFTKYSLSKTFQPIQEAARNSGCEIQGVKIEILGFAVSHISDTHLRSDIRTLMKSLVVSLSKPLNLDLSFNYDSRSLVQLRYDHKTATMDLSGLEFGDRYYNYTNYLKKVLSCLLAFRITVLNIQDCWFDGSEYPMILCSPTLERLTLRRVSLKTGHFDRNLWSSLLEEFSHLRGLAHFELQGALYEFDQLERDYEYYFTLSSGQYVAHDWKRTANFRLSLSDTDEPFVIRGEDIPARIKSLAVEVAQMEANKISDIETHGRVRDRYVKMLEFSGSGDDEAGVENTDQSGVENTDQTGSLGIIQRAVTLVQGWWRKE